MVTDSISSRLVWARERHGKYKRAVDASRAFGWVESTYHGHENGDRDPSRRAAKKYAKAYGVRWEWLLEGDGSANSPRATARMIGYVGGGSECHFYASGQINDTIELPPGGGQATVAVEVRGNSMRGIADDGWLIYYDELRNPPTEDLYGKLCVVETEDGKVLVKVLQQGRKKGRFDLESLTESTVRDQRIVWAAKVTWIKPR